MSATDVPAVCPHCGAAVSYPGKYVLSFECDSRLIGGDADEPAIFEQGAPCMKAEIKQLRARLAAAEGALREIAEAKLMSLVEARDGWVFSSRLAKIARKALASPSPTPDSREAAEQQ